VALRLKNAEQEMAAQGEFDDVVVNDDLDRAVAQLREILRNARLRAAAARQE
jgi:guanylate kinase